MTQQVRLFNIHLMSNMPPPGGDPTQAEKYITQLIQLIEQDKLTVNHTDLTKFDPSNLEVHYRLDLDDYQIEVSHSKHPNSGKDSYIILFNNLKKLAEKISEKVILAYMHLEHDQFTRFKKASLEQAERVKKVEEERKLKNALQPVDEILEVLENQPSTAVEIPPQQSIMAVS